MAINGAILVGYKLAGVIGVLQSSSSYCFTAARNYHDFSLNSGNVFNKIVWVQYLLSGMQSTWVPNFKVVLDMLLLHY